MFLAAPAWAVVVPSRLDWRAHRLEAQNTLVEPTHGGLAIREELVQIGMTRFQRIEKHRTGWVGVVCPHKRLHVPGLVSVGASSEPGAGT